MTEQEQELSDGAQEIAELVAGAIWNDRYAGIDGAEWESAKALAEEIPDGISSRRVEDVRGHARAALAALAAAGLAIVPAKVPDDAIRGPVSAYELREGAVYADPEGHKRRIVEMPSGSSRLKWEAVDRKPGYQSRGRAFKDNFASWVNRGQS